MKRDFEIMEEAVKLEENISELYRTYSKIFSEDKDFWTTLAREEVKHATLLKGLKEIYLGKENFPDQMIYDKIDEMKDVNRNIEDIIKKYKTNSPPIKEAYEFAYNIENSSYELHYQNQLEKKSTSLMEMFKRLNSFDKNHAERIDMLIKEKGI